MKTATTIASALCALLLSIDIAHGENTYTVPLFHAVGNESGQGFVRILNASEQSGTISITAWDDAGSEFGPLALAINASTALHFNSEDLEDGNPSKRLTGSTGDGQGDWRLRLTTELNLIVLAFVRTADGFLTSIHDTVRGQWDAELERHVYRVSGANLQPWQQHAPSEQGAHRQPQRSSTTGHRLRPGG